MKKTHDASKASRLNIYINPEVVRRLKAEALHQGKPMNQLAEEILDAKLPGKVVITGKWKVVDIDPLAE